MLLPTTSLTSSLNSLRLSSTFFNGNTQLTNFKPHPKPTPKPMPFFLPKIKAKKEVQGKVVCSTNDKTVSVEVTRVAPHPKYHRRVRIKKKFQAHDPENQFKVGDMVVLEQCRPISKTKSLLAVPVRVRVRNEKKDALAAAAAAAAAAANGEGGGAGSGELGIPFESQVEESS